MENEGTSSLRLSGLLDLILSIVLLATSIIALVVGLVYLNVSETLTNAIRNGNVYFNMLTDILDSLPEKSVGAVGMVLFVILLVGTAVSFFFVKKDFSYAKLGWETAKKKQLPILIAAVLQGALTGVAIWQIVSIAQNSAFPSDITFYIAIALTVLFGLACITKLRAFSKIKNYKVNTSMLNTPAYPYGGIPRGASVSGNGDQGYVYTPNQPVEPEEELSDRKVEKLAKEEAENAEIEKLQVLLTTGVIDKDEYERRVKLI